MAVKINKKPKEEAPAANSEPQGLTLPALAAEVDELVEILKWNDKHEADPRFKRMETLKKLLRTVADDNNEPLAVVVIPGVKYEVEFSPKPNETKIEDVRKAHMLLGDETFYAVAKIPATAVNDYLTLPQREQIVTSMPTGSRRLKDYRNKSL